MMPRISATPDQCLKLPALLGSFALLSACAQTNGPQPAAELALSGDPLDDAAALLAAAEAAHGAQERAPLVERLNAMNLVLAEGAVDDPLAQWRSQYHGQTSIPFRGRTLGPAYRRTRVEAGTSMKIEQIFYAGQRARIAAQASGSPDVAMEISNPREEAVCARDLAPRANCNWLPIFTERFSIELENRGSQPASVYIVFR